METLVGLISVVAFLYFFYLLRRIRNNLYRIRELMEEGVEKEAKTVFDRDLKF